ncbi:hypothetical protein RclHR1_03400023 [Rhizophagus clarus]|uniref:Uncharacterized protein n=1 Tax=Rhizophagus clarus TaxID=94130 RepID=A0A2Z6RRC8_9GLOM|nr:hypothetical protein RclHR1_03400023 [Rhizophagus clarus]
MSDEMEKLFSKYNKLEEIQKATKTNLQLKIELKDSIAAIQELLNNRTERLILNENKFTCKSPVISDEIEVFFKVMLAINTTLRIDKITQIILRKHEELQDFIKTYCQLRTYSFQIKKCDESSCNICKPPRTSFSVFQSLHFLSDPMSSANNSEHYAEFNMLYGKEISDQHQPSKIEV